MSSSLLRYVKYFPMPDLASTLLSQCGSVTEASTCPECRVPIGDDNRRFLISNTRALEFEDLSRSNDVGENSRAPGGQ